MRLVSERLIGVVFAGLLLIATASARADIDRDATEFLPGLELFQDNVFDQAGRTWDALSERLNDSLADDATLERAGVASVLASLSWERAGSARAYSAWARAIEAFLRARTSWTDARDRLVDAAESAAQLLSNASSDEGAVSASADLVALIAVIESTDLGAYGGPSPGLTTQVANSDSTTVSKGYFARPLAVVEQDEIPQEEVRGMRLNALDDEASAESQVSIGRGMDSDTEVGMSSAVSTTANEAETVAARPDRKVDSGVDTSATARGVAPAPEAVDATGQTRSVEQQLDVEIELPFVEVADVDEGMTVMGVRISPDTRLLTDESTASDEDSDVVDSTVFEDQTPEQNATELRPQDELLQDAAFSTLAGSEESEKNDVAESRDAESKRYGPGHAELAKAAWNYFVRNRNEQTGMINAVQSYPRSTMWDIGSGIAAIVSAEKLGLIKRTELRQWLDLYLRTLEDMPLYNDELPNREYSVDTGRMIGRGNKRDDTGTGWSALDIGRSMIWLRIVHNWYPQMRSRVETVMDRWQVDRLVADRRMNGAFVGRRGEKYYREGRLGYEQYSASGMTLWGLDVGDSLDYDFTNTVEIQGETLIYDTRSRPFYTSDPFVLSRIELGGIDESFVRLADLVYEIQRKRWEQTGELLVAAEDSLDKKPWFAYNNVTWFDEPWRCMAFSGKPIDECPTTSTKNALGFSVIYDDSFAQALGQSVRGVESKSSGLYAGRYPDNRLNRSLNINTNAIVLEILLYLKRDRKPFIDMPRLLRDSPALSDGGEDTE